MAVRHLELADGDTEPGGEVRLGSVWMTRACGVQGLVNLDAGLLLWQARTQLDPSLGWQSVWRAAQRARRRCVTRRGQLTEVRPGGSLRELTAHGVRGLPCPGAAWGSPTRTRCPAAVHVAIRWMATSRRRNAVPTRFRTEDPTVPAVVIVLLWRVEPPDRKPDVSGYPADLAATSAAGLAHTMPGRHRRLACRDRRDGHDARGQCRACGPPRR